jgi:hypothetical protein
VGVLDTNPQISGKRRTTVYTGVQSQRCILVPCLWKDIAKIYKHTQMYRHKGVVGFGVRWHGGQDWFVADIEILIGAELTCM